MILSLLFSSLAFGEDPLFSAENLKTDDDLQTVLQYRQKALELTDDVRDIIMATEKAAVNNVVLLNERQRNDLTKIWFEFSGCLTALEKINLKYESYLKEVDESKKRSFLIARTSFNARYLSALFFIGATASSPTAITALKEISYNSTLRTDEYSSFKNKYLSLTLERQFVHFESAKISFPAETSSDEKSVVLNDSADIIAWRPGTFSLRTENKIGQLRNIASVILFPAQRGLARFLAKHRLYRGKQFLINSSQLQEISHLLFPGDLLFTRREWNLSNIGLPGFWTHMIIYIGTAEKREVFFNDQEIHNWVISMGEKSGSFEKLISTSYPSTTELLNSKDSNGDDIRVLEALGVGVIVRSIESSGYCDSLSALRPRISKLAIAQSIHAALAYYGKPYDYAFDFSTDTSVVCSELVYKAYDNSRTGLNFPVKKIAGRTVMPPNKMIKEFDEKFNCNDRQWDFVFFLDGSEKHRAAFPAGENDFRNSWKRAKWSILLKD